MYLLHYKLYNFGKLGEKSAISSTKKDQINLLQLRASMMHQTSLEKGDCVAPRAKKASDKGESKHSEELEIGPCSRPGKIYNLTTNGCVSE